MISGSLKPGDRLGAERDLTQVYSVSLGTVQRAMDELVSLGAVKREVGRGTFVLGFGSSVEAQYVRFQNAKGIDLPVYWKILGLETCAPLNPASDFFGKGKQLVRIDRLMDVDHKASMLSHFFLEQDLAAPLRSGDLLKDNTNIRLFLYQRFAIRTLHIGQRFGFEPIDEPSAQLLKLKAGQPCFVIELRGYSESQEPIFLQRILSKPHNDVFFTTVARG